MQEGGLAEPATERGTTSEKSGASLTQRIQTYRWHIAFLLVGYTIYFFPEIFLGWDAYVLIHDHLDSVFVYPYLLAESGTSFSVTGSATVPQMLGGLPRTAFPSGFNVVVALFAVLEPFTAYVVNRILVHLIAFVGMLLLLRRFFFRHAGSRNLAFGIAFVFSLIPFYATGFGISVAGQPLLVYSFLEIAERSDRVWHWLVVAGFPLYSSLVGIGPFLGVLLAALWVWKSWERHRPDLRFAAAMSIWVLVYLLVEAPFIAATVGGTGFTSHRSEFRLGLLAPDSLTGLIRAFVSRALYGQHHAGTFLTLPIAAAVVLAAAVERRRPRRLLPLIIGVITIAGILLFHTLYRPLFVRHMGDDIPLLASVQFDRFYLLLPLIWFGLFAQALAVLICRRWWSAAYGFVMLQAVGVLITNAELKMNVRGLFADVSAPTFREFFAPGMFKELASHIGRPKAEYRVASVGLHPSIPLFNDFYTVDGYFYNYPVQRKHAVARVIRGELRKDPVLDRYFTHWGSAAYIFSAELGNRLHERPTVLGIGNLAIDVRELSRLGADYVISSVPIDNASDLGLRLERRFGGPADYWSLYLYRLTPAPNAEEPSTEPVERGS